MAGIITREAIKRAFSRNMGRAYVPRRNISFNPTHVKANEPQITNIKKLQSEFVQTLNEQPKKFNGQYNNNQLVLYNKTKVDLFMQNIRLLLNNLKTSFKSTAEFYKYIENSAKEFINKLKTKNILIETKTNNILKSKIQREADLLNDINKNAEEYFNKLTNKLTNLVVITNVMVILTLALTIDYMTKPIENIGINKEKIDLDILIPVEPLVTSPKKQELIKTITDTFNIIIEKIKNTSKDLYNSLKDNFNRIVKLSNVNYDYIKSILENIGNIQDINKYKEALNNFNIYCTNLIILSSEETKKIINNSKLIIDEYASFASTKLGNLAKDNYDKFLTLIKLPNVNFEKTFASMINYLKNLHLELLLVKGKEYINLMPQNNETKQLTENIENTTKNADTTSEIMNKELENKIKQQKKNEEELIRNVVSLQKEYPELIAVIEKFDKEKNTDKKMTMYYMINNSLIVSPKNKQVYINRLVNEFKNY
jgi:hypothetical protein